MSAEGGAFRTPPEIITFFTKPGGHSLILRGNAGTGKTTFALQTIEDLSAIEKSYYLSTRVSDASLFTQFPWLREKVNRGETTPRALAAEDATKNGGPSPPTRAGLASLKGIGGTAGGPTRISVSIGRDLSELEAIYKTLETKRETKSLIVIDSIDALAQKYGESCANLILAIQSDVVEGYGANVLFVLESSDPQLDYLGDGVIFLSSLEYQKRRIREIEIFKLRGCEIKRPRYLFTLRGGRIQSFGHDLREDAASWGKWSPIPDRGARLSFGMNDLDTLLGGGLEKGSIVLVEMGYGVPTSVSTTLESGLVANFISMKRGVFWVPLRKASAEGARGHIVSMMNEADFDKYVRIPEKATQIGAAPVPYVIPVEGATAFADFNWQNLAFSLQNASMPFLSLLGFDTMESIYGNQVMDQLTDHLLSIRRYNGVFVGITSPSASSTHRLADLATTHIKIDRIGGTIVLFGEKPFTECNALSFAEKENGGGITLTPIL